MEDRDKCWYFTIDGLKTPQNLVPGIMATQTFYNSVGPARKINYQTLPSFTFIKSVSIKIKMLLLKKIFSVFPALILLFAENF